MNEVKETETFEFTDDQQHARFCGFVKEEMDKIYEQVPEKLRREFTNAGHFNLDAMGFLVWDGICRIDQIVKIQEATGYDDIRRIPDALLKELAISQLRN